MYKIAKLRRDRVFTFAEGSSYNKVRFGFTLVEVLITLGIIGIVSAMTIPTLMARYNEHVTLTKFKKTYSILSQALRMSLADDNSGFDTSITNGSRDSAEYIYKTIFQPHLKVISDCAFGEGCFYDGYYKKFQNDELYTILRFNNGERYMVKLMDGSSLAFYYVMPYIIVYYDINGEAKPNKIGVDLFQLNFDIETKSIKSDSSMTTCYINGLGCSGWIIKKGNLDYWHYDNLEY